MQASHQLKPVAVDGEKGHRLASDLLVWGKVRSESDTQTKHVDA